jgi:hypothetical protein
VNIEVHIAELCDEFTLRSRDGEVDVVAKSVVLLIEYAGFELGRQGHTALASEILYAAKRVETFLQQHQRAAERALSE